MLLLENQVQDYAWGRIDGMSGLVGAAPSHGPEAELWSGSHPSSPSMVVDDPGGRTLDQVLAADPSRWLGPRLAEAGHTVLPFLVKVLSIGSPLSAQAHPTAEQAAEGFAREDDDGVAIDSPRRSYKDSNAKPEALVALTETWALCGFRPAEEAAELVSNLGLGTLDALVAALDEGGSTGLRVGLGWLLRLGGAGRDAVVTGVRGALGGRQRELSEDPYYWVARLFEMYPNDPTCLLPLLLEVCRLDPDDSVHLPAGNLHAYLEGAGVEIMAASDNVVRGGLTPKHIDVAELVRIVRFEPGVPPPPRRSAPAVGITLHDAGEEAFSLASIDATAAGGSVSIEATEPSLLLASGGPVRVEGPVGSDGHHETVELVGTRGAFVPPGDGVITVSGPGRLWWATTGSGHAHLS